FFFFSPSFSNNKGKSVKMNVSEDKCTLRRRDNKLYVVSGGDLLNLCKWAETVHAEITVDLCKPQVKSSYIEQSNLLLVGGAPRRAKNLGPSQERDLQELLIYVTKNEDGGIRKRNVEAFKGRYLSVGVTYQTGR